MFQRDREKVVEKENHVIWAGYQVSFQSSTVINNIYQLGMTLHWYQWHPKQFPLVSTLHSNIATLRLGWVTRDQSEWVKVDRGDSPALGVDLLHLLVRIFILHTRIILIHLLGLSLPIGKWVCSGHSYKSHRHEKDKDKDRFSDWLARARSYDAIYHIFNADNLDRNKRYLFMHIF